ncbi:MAG: cytidylate kinase family protein [Chloroflexota bacterium]
MAIITISRGTFSGGQRLAECVAARLGYRCTSREVLAEAAKRYGVPEERLSQALTKSPSILEHVTSERFRYLAFIRSALIKGALDEKIVYHGHAGHLLLSDVPHVLRVRVIASMEFRTKALTDHHNLSREEAIQLIKKVDEERVRWTRFLYHVDWKNPSLYDVVVNLDHVGLPGACELVCQTANMEQFKATPESRKTMADLVLGSHLRAIIASNRGISDGDLHIGSDEGVITITGTVGSLVDADRVRVMVREAPGVKEIRSRMQVRLPVFTTSIVDES